jgi:hypothetical protein
VINAGSTNVILVPGVEFFIGAVKLKFDVGVQRPAVAGPEPT